MIIKESNNYNILYPIIIFGLFFSLIVFGIIFKFNFRNPFYWLFVILTMLVVLVRYLFKLHKYKIDESGLFTKMFISGKEYFVKKEDLFLFASRSHLYSFGVINVVLRSRDKKTGIGIDFSNRDDFERFYLKTKNLEFEWKEMPNIKARTI